MLFKYILFIGQDLQDIQDFFIILQFPEETVKPQSTFGGKYI